MKHDQPSQPTRGSRVLTVRVTDYLRAAVDAAAQREGVTRRRYAELALRAYLDAHGERPLRLAAQLQLDALADRLPPSTGAPGEGWDEPPSVVLTMRLATDLVLATGRAADAVGLSTAAYVRRALACAVEGGAAAEAERMADAPDRWAQVLDLLGRPPTTTMPQPVVASVERRQMVTA